MHENRKYRAEEAHFLADMAGVLGSKVMLALERLLDEIGLDYGGIDFGLSQSGEILLFEANATMVVEQPDGDSCWDYRRTAVERIQEAVRNLLMASAGVVPGANPISRR